MILMKDIIREGNPLLREKSVNVELPLSNEDEEILLSMIEYIDNSIDEEIAEKYDLRAAVGIAAPQIGILKKMFVIYLTDEQGNEHFYPLVNPKIVSYSDEQIYLPGGEGCLSVDREVTGLIHRARRITADAHLYDPETRTLKHVILKLKNYPALVFQHEYDHLFGTLFPDRINKEKPLFVPENSKPVVFPKYEETADK
ncbi:MAG: peptide deformylase [Bacilli bacterium]|nr:peptide deformylase [Bacilli bacterium]